MAVLPNVGIDLDGVQLCRHLGRSPKATQTPRVDTSTDNASSPINRAQTPREKKLEVIRERLADRHGYWWDLTRIRYDEEYDEILWDIAPTLTDPIIVNLYRTGIRTLPRWLTRLPRLVGLLVHENRLVDLPEWLPELSSLERLCLSLNPGIVVVPDIVAALPSLRRLELDDTGITCLPESMRTMTHLEQLTLSDTPLTHLPSWIGQLHNLRRLHLTNTPIQTLPESIGQLANLQSLLLDRTALTTLPNSLGNLHALEELYLSDARALTALPDSVRALPNLRVTLDGTAIPHA